MHGYFHRVDMYLVLQNNGGTPGPPELGRAIGYLFGTETGHQKTEKEKKERIPDQAKKGLPTS